jgi:succinyl-CoA synthetase beta subunit
MADSAVRLAPLTEADVDDMVDSLRAKRLLEGFRGLPACDRHDIAAVAQALGRLLAEHPEIAEVEINPLRITASGALALDALVVLANSSDTETTT